MIKNLPKIYRNDKWITELYKIDFQDLKQRNTDNYNNIFFKSLNDYGCQTYEQDLALNVTTTDLETRRRSIKNKWRINNKLSLQVLQSLSNTYFGKYVSVEYNGDAELHFHARVGFLRNVDDDTKHRFIDIVEEIKPAHFIYDWITDKNKWQDYYISDRYWGVGLNYSYGDWLNRKWGFEETPTGKTWEYMNTRSWDDTLNKEID